MRLTLLGQGYFQYQANGFPTRTGRMQYLAQEDAISFARRMAYSPRQKSNRRP